MIWLTIGALLANKRFEKISSTNLFVAAIVGYLLQNAECGASRYLSWGVSSESTFALLLVCPSLFLLTKRIKINIRNGAFIRLYSTILYCTHYSMIYIFITFLCTGKLSTTIIVSIVALLASLFIYKFESRVKALKWLH